MAATDPSPRASYADAVERAFGARAPEPVADEPLDLIFVEGLRGDTVIGIDDDELRVPQPLVIDVAAGVPRPAACSTDHIGDTLDYGKLRAWIVRLMADHRLQLLEAFAERLAEGVLTEFGARWVRVKVVKPSKFPDVTSVGVQIERRRAAAPAAPVPTAGGRPLLQVIGSGMVPGRR